MAEFQKVMKQYDRMCIGIIKCDECPISMTNNGTDVSCSDLMRKYPEEAERIIMQWASEHPLVTNRRKFEEVFGFTPATMFEVNCRNADWLDEEYKGGDNHDT